MDNKQHRYRKRIPKKTENVFGGILLLAIGGILLARQAGANIPSWLFTWPMILIITGLFVGIKTHFRDFGWLLLTGIGVFFLIDRMHDIPLRDFIWPAVIIVAGILVLGSAFFKSPFFSNDKSAQKPGINENDGYEGIPNTTEEEIMEVISIFGSAKRVIFSKNFKGGEIISVFGSSEINLTNADFNGKLTLEIVQVFGGAKLIIPSHWEVQSKTAVFFGGIEDKRSIPTIGNPEKILILEGVTIFGGVTIASY